jgi:hypothetical protein
VETAPIRGLPHFTRSNGGNSETFNKGPGAFLALSNPFTITSTSVWTVSLMYTTPCIIRCVMCTIFSIIFPGPYTHGRVQFFIDALDRAARSGDTEVIINRFPIDLELELGAAFTERTTYTGIYNISGLGFDMSFRVQCSRNYYGPNCTTFCAPMEGLYTCDSRGNIICVQSGRDPVTNCTTCLSRLPEKDPETNCTTCLSSFHDLSTNCTECFPNTQWQPTILSL